ncbi:MAG: TetR/AcrR family transcriptional regulator [Candidatus Izemoplasmatales bacterium]|nr:TetR/AcrR family transcriptional regulator [Candidatus Izemoplasmatales bacterium]
MPKALTDFEKIAIKKELQLAAADSLQQYGAKKTTVDDLVKKVKIPKGTFYLFYKSKEILFFELFRQKHDDIQNQFLNTIESIKNNINVDSITDLMFNMYKKMDNSFLLSFVTGGDLELVMRKIPYASSEEHAKQDNSITEKLFSILPNMNKEHIEEYSAAMRLILVSVLHKKEIGIDIFDDALKLAIRGLVTQMLSEVNDDKSK